MTPVAEPQLTNPLAAEMMRAAFEPGYVPVNQPEIKKATDEHAKGNNETALKLIKGNLLPYTDDDIERALINKLSTKRGPDQRKVVPTDAQEKDRVDKGKTMAKDVKEFIEKGTISPALKTALVDYLKTSSNAFKDAIAAGANADAMAQSMLDDAAFKDILRQRYIDVFDPSRKISQEDIVRNLQLELDKLQAQLKDQVTPADLKDKQDKVRAAEVGLAAVQPQLLELAGKSDEYQDLARQQARYKQDAARLKPIVDPMLADMKTHRADLAALNPADANYAVDRAAILARMAPIEADANYKAYIFRETELKRYSTLGKEVGALQAAVLPAQQALEQAKQELTDIQQLQRNALSPAKRAEIEADIKAKKAELADAKDALNIEMLKYARDVVHLPQDAVEAYLTKSFEGMKQTWKEERKKALEKDASDQAALAQSALDKLSNAWKKNKDVQGITIKRPDAGKALEALADVFKPGGLDNISTKIAAMTDPQLGLLGLNTNEIAALRAKMADPEFKKTASDAYCKEALSDYFLAGGRLDQRLVEALTSTDYGQKILTDARAKVESSLKLSASQKEQMKELDDLLKGRKEGKGVGGWLKVAGLILALLILLGMIKGGGP